MTSPSATVAVSRQAALAALVEAIRQLEGLTEQVGPFALPSGTCARAPGLVAAVCAALGVPLSFDAPGGDRDQDFAVTALAAEIQQAQRAPELDGLDRGEVAVLAAGARGLYEQENASYRRRTVHRPDGTVLTAIDGGRQDAPCIVVSSACAMSYRLALPWLRALSGSYRCIVPQTRGTSGRIEVPEAFDQRGYDVRDQAADLISLIEALPGGPVHLMGLCGGAVPALLAGRDRPDLVHSLSLWHADLELGDEAEKTNHQTNLRALLDMAGESRETAAWIRERLTSGPMTGVPAGVGPLVVRPYASAELFYRYAKLTAATMHWDSRRTAAEVTQPCLIVTSQDDNTAHPAGSRRLAEILPDARLVVTDHGTHLDAFKATLEQASCLTSFLELHPVRPRIR